MEEITMQMEVRKDYFSRNFNHKVKIAAKDCASCIKQDVCRIARIPQEIKERLEEALEDLEMDEQEMENFTVSVKTECKRWAAKM